MYEPARSLLWQIRRGLRRMSIDVTRFNRQSADYQISDLFHRRHIDCILDVGANRGQFARYMRLQGFRGTIHSFEPLTEAFAEMRSMALHDDKWHVHNFALSDRNGSALLNVGTNDQTSSLHAVAAGDGTRLVEYSGTQTVECRRFDELHRSGALGSLALERTIMKLDVQGHELDVLSGVGDDLNLIAALFVEASITKIYDSEPSFDEISEFLRRFNFYPIAFKGGLHHPEAGYLMQIDVIFEKVDLLDH